ncbi:MAG: VOC family protein [Gammaproteobacteria bacterium]|nr:VOC family protein [Gammaproteobacteria bacterium]
MENTNREFELRGLNHVAMVCKDMQRTVDFYGNVLGMKLIRTLDLPGGSGQHFFFDMGGGQCFAFFWFPEAPDRNPGVSNPRANIDPATALTDPTGFLSSHGSMNHFAFDVAPEKIAEYRDKLIAKGVQVSSFMHHDASPSQLADSVTESVWISSIYFQDPDGIVLEFAANQREFNTALGDRRDHIPATPADGERYRQEGAAMRMMAAQSTAG